MPTVVAELTPEVHH